MVLITGATGTVRSEVVRQLASVTQDANIKAAGHSLQKLEKVAKSNRVEYIQIDYDKPESLIEALKGLVRVFLLTPFDSDMVKHSSKLITEVKNTGNVSI